MKSKSKKILSILMCLCLIISTLTVSMVSVGAETYGDFEYEVLDDGTVEIVDYTGSATTLEIPAEIDGKAVTSIGGSAFNGCTSLTSVTIGNSVTSIGEEAFYNCSSLTSITIPDSVTSIGNRAFKDCTSLTSVTIPNSVTSIGYEAFKYCESLTSVTIPDSVTSIGGDAFYNTGYYNNEDNWENNVLYIGKYLIDAKTSISGDYTIKDGTKVIADEAFYYCTSLTSITIPDSVTSIGRSAFYYCTSLTSVTIPDSVTSIGDRAFSECTSLTSITIPDSVTSIGYEAFGYIWVYFKGYVVKDGFTIKGYTNSEAERYANDNDITFIALDGENPTTTTEPTTPTQSTTKPTVTTTTVKATTTSFKAPKVKAKASKGKISLTLKKVKGTAGYQVRYKVNGKWKVKTFKIKKNATKVIKKLKKGTYKVQIRLINNSKKALSNWSKAKTIKVK